MFVSNESGHQGSINHFRCSHPMTLCAYQHGIIGTVNHSSAYVFNNLSDVLLYIYYANIPQSKSLYKNPIEEPVPFTILCIHIYLSILNPITCVLSNSFV